MIALPILTTSLIHFLFKRFGECTFWELWSERVNSVLHVMTSQGPQANCTVYGCKCTGPKFISRHAVVIWLEPFSNRSFAPLQWDDSSTPNFHENVCIDTSLKQFNRYSLGQSPGWRSGYNPVPYNRQALCESWLILVRKEFTRSIHNQKILKVTNIFI